jgi:hypothetical protein
VVLDTGCGRFRRGLDFFGRRVRERNDIPNDVETDVRRAASLTGAGVGEIDEAAGARSILTEVGTSWELATGKVSRDRSANRGSGGEIISL